MIVEHQATLATSGLPLKSQCSRQTADTTTEDHTIESLSRINDVCGKAIEQTIANLVSGFDDAPGISIRVGVVADAAIAGPVFRWILHTRCHGKKLSGRDRAQKQSSETEQRSV